MSEKNREIPAFLAFPPQGIAPESLGIQIFDDFFADPDTVRANALAASYTAPPPPGQPGGVAYRSVCSEASVAELDALLGERLGKRVRVNTANFRYTTKGTKKRAVCHTDLGLGDATAVIYLTSSEMCRGGTAFFRHTDTGDTFATADHMNRYDTKAASQWVELCRAEMRYNRCVVFPAEIFHSVIPLYFGDGPDNSRLTQVAWFNYGTRRSPYAEARYGK